MMNYSLLLFLQLLFEELHHKIRIDSDVKKFVPGHEWGTVILVIFIETLSCYALPKCRFMYHPFENKKRISTLGKKRRSIHRDKLVDKAWHEKSSVSTQCSKKFGEYCSIHQHAGIFGKKCGKLTKRATCHLRENTSLTSSSLAKKYAL